MEIKSRADRNRIMRFPSLMTNKPIENYGRGQTRWFVNESQFHVLTPRGEMDRSFLRLGNA